MTTDAGPRAALSLVAIATVRSPYRERFAVPRQAGLAANVRSTVVCDQALVTRESLRGLEPTTVSHVWLTWWFHGNANTGDVSTVRPPRLGGNERLGCFATRSPYRPNPIGLSAVRLCSVDVDRRELVVAGADLVDGTPVLDIKPYVPYADRIDDARCEWASAPPAAIPVVFAPNVAEQLAASATGETLMVVVRDCLQWDPRPAYRAADTRDDDRIYGVILAGWNVRFVRRHDAVEVVEVTRPVDPRRRRH